MRAWAAAMLSAVVAGCGGGSGDGGGAADAGARVVNGSFVKGPVQGATVQFFAIDAADGSATGSPLTGAVVTQSGGNFSVSGLPSAPVLAQTSGGEYFDESDPATGTSRRRIALGSFAFETVIPAGATSFAITPYSMALLLKARDQAAGSNFVAVYAAVLAQATQAFGFNPVTLTPADPTAPAAGTSDAQRQYALLLGAASQAIYAWAVSAGRYPDANDVAAFIDDFRDGRLDDASLPDEIRRFRNNNSAAYGATPLPVVDEDALSQPAPVPNQAPTITAAASRSTAEDVALSLSLTDLTVSDPDDTAYPSGFTLIVLAGSNYTVSGTTVTPAADFNGALSVAVKVNDGDADSNTFNVPVSVSAVADAPRNTVPGAQSVAEDTALAIAGLSAADPDGDLASVQLSVASGTLTVSVAGGATVSAGANGSAGLTLAGTQAQINAALATLSYQGGANFTGVDSLAVIATDGGGATDSDSVAITVSAANDPPQIVTGFGGGSIAEDSNTGSLDYTIADDATPVSGLGFAATSNNATLVPSGGFDYTADSDGIGNATLTITPAPHQYGSATITVTVTDGDGATDTESFVLTVTPVSDAPSSQAFAIAMAQDTPHVFGTAEFNFLDADDSNGDASDVDNFAAVILTSLPAAGTLVLNDGAIDQPISALPAPPISTADIGLGRFKFVPAAGASGSPYAQFNFQVQDDGDNGPNTSIAYTATVNVLAGALSAERLPYLSGAGELKLLDPALPLGTGNPEVLDSALPVGDDFEHETLFAATISAGNASDIKPGRLLYLKDQRLFRVTLEAGQDHTPVQLSNLTDICHIAGTADDFSDPDASVVRVDTAGTDGTCDSGDEASAPAYLVRLTDTASTPPVQAGVGRCCGGEGLRDASGALVELLTAEVDGLGNVALNRRDPATLALIAQVATLQNGGSGSPFSSAPRGIADQHVYLRMRRDVDSSMKLYRYDVAAATLTEVYVYGVPDGSGFVHDLDVSIHDASNFYFSDGDKLFKVPHGATVPVSTPAVVAAAPIGHLDQTATQLLYESHDFINGSGGVYALPKAGGAAVVLAADDAVPTIAMLAGADRGRIYVSLQSGSTTPSYQARIVDESGALLEQFTDAQWAGEQWQPATSLSTDFDSGLPAAAIFLRDGASGSTGVVQVIDPLTGALTGDRLGLLAGLEAGPSVFGSGFGRYVQVTAFTTAQQTDIYLGDAQADNAGPLQLVEGVASSDDLWLLGGRDDDSSGPQGPDSDGDGLTDADEGALGTDPNLADTDGDGLSDFDEVDNDGNAGDYQPGVDTDPLNPDTDGDGLDDGAESGTSATNADSDGDGIGDGVENELGSDPVATPNPVIYANKSCTAGCDGLSWSTGWPTQAQVLAAIDAAGSGRSTLAELLYVLYAPGTYGALALTDTPRSYIALVGSLGEGVFLPSLPQTTTFDAANSGSALRLSNIEPIVVAGVALTGGDSPQGGGVLLDGLNTPIDLSLRRVFIHTNRAEQGAGLALLAGVGTSDDYVEIVDSVIEGNIASSSSATAAGGGIYMTEGSLTLTRSHVVGNQASGIGAAAAGGGLYVEAAGLGVLIEDSEFKGNKVFGDSTMTGSGGAIHLEGSTFLDFYMEFSRILGNQTSGLNVVSSGGAGLYVGGNSRVLTVTSLFADNHASGGPGGGINAVDTPDFGLEHSQLLSNSSTRPGGGLHMHVPASGLGRAFNNLLVGNVATDGDADGGAIEIENGAGGSLKLDSNTVAFNQLTGNAGALGGGVSVFSTNAADTFRNNIVWFNDNATVTDPLNPQAGDNLFFDNALDASGNNVHEAGFTGNGVLADPLFRLGFYLDPSSTSVDAGDDTAVNVFFGGFAAPFTTSPDGSADAATVDIGFHYMLGKAADALVTGTSAFAVSASVGCPAASVHVSFATAEGPLGPGHLVTAENLAGGTGALSGLTALDPRGSGSVLAVDQGDGNYRFDLSGGQGVTYTFDAYVDGDGPHPVSFTCP